MTIFRRMKYINAGILVLCLFSGLSAFADAGFSIQREKPPAEIRFRGTGNLGGYLLVRYYLSYYQDDSLLKNPMLKILDTVYEDQVFRVQNGGKRWEESDRYLQFALVTPDSAHSIVDSFTIYLEKYNYEMNITGVKDGELQNTMKKTKAYYEYGLIGEEGTGKKAKLYRWIFIGCSVAGFVLLTLFFLKRKNNKTP